MMKVVLSTSSSGGQLVRQVVVIELHRHHSMASLGVAWKDQCLMCADETGGISAMQVRKNTVAHPCGAYSSLILQAR